MSFDPTRLERLRHPLARRIYEQMYRKETNLVLSLDGTQQASWWPLIDLLGPHICVLKTHIDILEDYTPEVPLRLQEKAEQYGFLVFEDRKFADIGSIVQKQYGEGIYRIAEWADLVTAHSLPGPGILKGLEEIARPRQRGVLLISELSSQGHLMTESYETNTLAMAENFRELVVGFICQKALDKTGSFLHFTPGVQLERGKDHLGQQYRTPEDAIQAGSDLLIVGRGIYQASDPVSAAIAYRKAGMKALKERAC